MLTIETYFTGASPMRWMLATLLPLFVAVRGLKKKLFTFFGALLAMVRSPEALLVSQQNLCTLSKLKRVK